ncbi:hypothetical protein [Nocardioides marmorisolisilvae]|uniref:Uncharacterized protein n=1 Tax=Nocardioides marmorisolisilvae TaxID=1542737 RepID=A0A3N0DQ25_9ACTN|nr:hypothetical protein [Nocardioides marmorisolisilvae]RNL77749.1 hypothetical protein EFL95_17300 [Nocardioides marmorisolisilvae]
MIALSIGATSVAHGIHYAVLGVGLAGLLALLGPQLVGGRRGTSFRDEHSLRVRALSEQISDGTLGLRITPAPSVTLTREPVDLAGARYLPLAVVSSAAAAGVHAAVGPEHFREQVLFGLFFAGSALAQICWSALMALRPSRALLVAAVIGNSAVLVLWLTTRTVGLPGLLPNPEAVGPWDLCCGAWELIVVITSARALRTHVDLRLPAWADWEPVARFWAIGSVLALLALTLSGAGA